MCTVSVTDWPLLVLVRVMRQNASHKLEGVLLQLWKFFAKSPKQAAFLVKAQEWWRKMKLLEKARSVVAKKVRKACRTRWLVTSNAVDGVYEDFVPIIQTINLCCPK